MSAPTVPLPSIDPRPADTRHPPADLPLETLNSGLQAVDANGGVAHPEAWSDILAASNLGRPSPCRVSHFYFGSLECSLQGNVWRPEADCRTSTGELARSADRDATARSQRNVTTYLFADLVSR